MKKAIMGGVLVIGIILTMTGISPSCTHDALNIAQFDSVCFERDIKHVFVNGCTSTVCHSGQGEGMNLTNYAGIWRGTTPGSPAQSPVYQAIISKLNQPMPPDHSLPEADRIKIRIWIEQGAKDTKCAGEPIPNLISGGEQQ